MKKHITVVAAVIIRENQVFSAQRDDTGEQGLKWEFSGGKVEVGESPEHALVREIREELSSTICIKRFFATVEHQYKTFDITLHAYLCDLREGTLPLSEHLASRWLRKDELETVDWAEADIPIMRMVKEVL